VTTVRDQDGIGGEPTALAPSSAGQQDATGDARLEPGTTAGDYTVVRFVGAGAMGDVYEGSQPVIGKRVAIKVLKRALASSEEALKRFTREARAVNRVDHPNVLDVFAYGRLDDGRLYLVMDLLEGQSLGSLLADRGALDSDEMLAILEPICSALDAAHREGIVHRDLKPDNVFLAGQGGARRVYVLDFGIAKIIHDEAASRGVETLTGEGSWMGTPLYMAPEQWSADDVTPRSDIYSLGVLTYQMIAGQAPYKSKSLPGLMEKHFNAEMPSLSTAAGPSVAPGLDAAVARALAKRPEDRFATAGEFLAALREAVGAASHGPGQRAAAAVTARPTFRPFRAVSSPDSPVPQRRAVLGAAIGGVAIAAVALAAYFALRDRKDAGTAPPAPETLSVGVSSVPNGAVVYCNNRKFGVTPTTVEIDRGEHGVLRLTKPGYATHETEIDPATHNIVSIDLEPVTEFEGVWKRSGDGGEIRMFKRKGERVAGYEMTAVDSEPRFLHFFEFTPSGAGDTVTFGAVKDFVDKRADNEISCHLPLHAEYRYAPVADRLELRLQEVSYDFVDGRCSNPVTSWTPFEPLERLAAAGSRTHALSEAGSGPIELPPPDKKSAPEKKTQNKKKPPAPKTKKQPKSPPPKADAEIKQTKEPAALPQPVPNNPPAAQQQANVENQDVTPQQVLPPPGK
jgi:serine/threonine-protein kinase